MFALAETPTPTALSTADQLNRTAYRLPSFGTASRIAATAAVGDNLLALSIELSRDSRDAGCCGICIEGDAKINIQARAAASAWAASARKNDGQ
jgi:hypothetical protein